MHSTFIPEVFVLGATINGSRSNCGPGSERVQGCEYSMTVRGRSKAVINCAEGGSFLRWLVEAGEYVIW